MNRQWSIELTHEYKVWFDSISIAEQDSIVASVEYLRRNGPQTGRPYVDTIKGSKFSNMKELRVTHGRRPIRIFFAFDPRRSAILLIGGDKTGQSRFYENMIPIADRLYEEHLKRLRSQGLIV